MPEQSPQSGSETLLLRSRSTNRLVRSTGIVLTLGLCAVLVGAVSRDRDPIELDLLTVTRQGMTVELVREGQVEPVHSDRVQSDCRWRTRILSIVPEGTWVQKGDVVCVLDSADIEEFLRSREVYLIRARAALDNSVQEEELTKARNERRLSQAEYTASTAEMLHDEFINATMPQQISQLEEQMQVERAQLAAAELEFDDIERLWARGYATSQMLDATSIKLLQRQLAMDRLMGNFTTITKFTHPRTSKRLDFSRTNAQRELVRTSVSNSLYLTRAQLNRLADERRVQIYQRYVDLAKSSLDACTLRAPRDGRVMYCNNWYLKSRGIRSVEEGKSIYFTQPVFQIPDERRMKVQVAIAESLITRVGIGSPVTTQLRGYEDIPIAGEIIS
ncbi:MAG: HlyD family efflux transporter periplasmic adaptor subunit, partial [Planctomycetaceae bacterium]|nr:HlyD family efflux transporter periplasmic adaptor subunit [Planctomycetaceae bacterium]